MDREKNDSVCSKTWKDLKSELTYRSKDELEVISQMAIIVNGLTNKRIELNLTQRELAKMAGMTQAQIARLETSYSVPSLETIMKVAVALGIKIGIVESINEQSGALA
ncbi:helix-turn-helix domain-containing protein [Paenibacillus pabuli]|uniref:helix-turn-helix domain-containing protein n=1 Tax=Paenibacillus pabuli TaxID=1472 RepID=UPI003CE7C9F2